MSLERMISNPRHWLRRIACALGLLLVWQLALAAQPCVDQPGAAESAVSPAPWSAGCTDLNAVTNVCPAKRHRSDAALSYPASGHQLSFAVLPIQGVRLSTLYTGTVFSAAPAPGHSPPVHIRLRRFLS